MKDSTKEKASVTVAILVFVVTLGINLYVHKHREYKAPLCEKCNPNLTTCKQVWYKVSHE
jgi:hypothetical protein